MVHRLHSDESRPADPEGDSRHPVVVFGDHQFCAGERLEVMRMASPHMHSQIEINFILEGAMTYRFDEQVMAVKAGELVLFWGMIPHQVCACEGTTRFVCLYVPLSIFLALPSIDRLRQAVFRGAAIVADQVSTYDREVFLRWRNDLLSHDGQLREIVREELVARIRRIDHDGWHDRRGNRLIVEPVAHLDAKRARSAERMMRFISEHATRKIEVKDVAEAANLHPNYAMTVFRQSVGLTINEAITRHRLDIAQSLLIATDRPVAGIAFESGFASLSSFYTIFERRFHASPRHFRQKMRAQMA